MYNLLVFWSTQKIGSHLTEDSQGKDVGIKLLRGHENTTNYHFVFLNHMDLFLPFSIFKGTYQSGFRDLVNNIMPQPYLSADTCKCLEMRSHRSLV